MSRSGFAYPVLVVIASSTGLWLLAGVDAWELIRYLAYEVGLVIGPGWLVLRALAPGLRSPLIQLGLAWPLGIVIELAAFSATAELDARGALPALLVIVGVAGAAAWRLRARRRPSAGAGEGAPRLGPGPAWALAAVIVVGIAYVALELFVVTPLPGTVPQVFYPSDTMFHLSLAAEAKHHWPLSSPQVADVPLHYHQFIYWHYAAASQVTGVELPVLSLRLAPLALAALLMIAIASSAAVITGRAGCAPLAAALLLLTSELDLLVNHPYPVGGIRDVWLWVSPSYALGLAVFVSAVTVAVALLDRSIERLLGVSRPAAWALLTLFLLGAGGAKVVALPLFVSGLGLYLALAWARTRRIDPTAAVMLAVSLFIGAGTYLALYAGGSGGDLKLSPGTIFEHLDSLFVLQAYVDGHLARIGFWATASAAAGVMLFAAIAATLAWRLGPGRSALGPGRLLLVCLLVPGLAAFLFLFTVNLDNVYFAGFALVAALPLAAEGTERATSVLRAGPGRLEPRTAALALVGLLILLGALAALGWHLALDNRQRDAVLLTYGALLLTALAAGVWLLRSPASKRPMCAAAVTMAVLAAVGLSLFLDAVPSDVRALIRGEPLYADASGLTPDEAEAAVWARDNLPEEAVLAIADELEDSSEQLLASLSTEIPALAERRALYEGWVYARGGADFTETVNGDVIPYRDRRNLQRRALFDGDPAALTQIVRRFGVTHLFLRRDEPGVSPAARRAGPRVYANETVEVIALPTS